jgi:hypothetical protein
MTETYLTKDEQELLKLEEIPILSRKEITKFEFTKDSTIFLSDLTELKLEKVNGKYKPVGYDWYLSPEEITNKNIMEVKYGGHWIDDKFVEDKDYKYFITELAAIVDSI